MATPAYQRKAAAAPGDNSWMLNQQDFDQAERETPTSKAGMAQRAHDLGISHDSDLEEELNELARLAGLKDEGNAFTAKLKDTPKGDTFSLGGKIHTDTSNLDEADAPVAKPTVKPVNGPKQKYGTIKQITQQGDDLNKPKRQDPATANKAANPMTNETMKLSGRLAAEYESIKKAN